MKVKKWISGVVATLAIGGLLVVSQPTWSYATGVSQGVQNFSCAGIGAALGRLQGGMVTTVSKLIGINESEIIKERQAGKSLVEIAETKGVDEQKLVNTVVEERKALLDQRVKDGLITEEQAQYCEDNMEQNIKNNLNRTTVGPANGNCGMRGSCGIGGGFGGGFGRGQRAMGLNQQ